jgi:nucleoid-associated protein YgaU
MHRMAAFPSPRRQGQKGPSLAGVALVSFLLAACGGGGDDETPTATLPPALPTQPPALQTTPTATPTEEVQGAQEQEYEIQAGDTLAAIADQFGVTVEAIVAANQIENPDLIQPGQTLIIPAPEAQ